MADLLALDEPPTAVFAASDMMALGAIRAVGDAGLGVPVDVSVIGYDDMQLAGHMNPPLTTIRQDKAGLGAAAGSALVRLIDGEVEAVTQSTVLPVELVRRGSTRPREAT
jgi:LacI family transcriptional regulator